MLDVVEQLLQHMREKRASVGMLAAKGIGSKLLGGFANAGRSAATMATRTLPAAARTVVQPLVPKAQNTMRSLAGVKPGVPYRPVRDTLKAVVNPQFPGKKPITWGLTGAGVAGAGYGAYQGKQQMLTDVQQNLVNAGVPQDAAVATRNQLSGLGPRLAWEAYKPSFLRGPETPADASLRHSTRQFVNDWARHKLYRATQAPVTPRSGLNTALGGGYGLGSLLATRLGGQAIGREQPPEVPWVQALLAGAGRPMYTGDLSKVIGNVTAPLRSGAVVSGVAEEQKRRWQQLQASLGIR